MMEYMKEQVLNISYHDRLDSVKEKQKQSFLKQHKWFGATVLAFFACCSFNFFLIYQFMQILKNV